MLPLALRGGRERAARRCGCFISSRSGWDTFWWRSLSSSASCCSSAIPTYALTVVVFLLLLSSGAGSLASRWLPETDRTWLPLVLIAAALLLYVFVLPGLLKRLVGLPFAVKLLVSAVLLVPLGFAMGMPFPTGLRALASSPVPEFPAAAKAECGKCGGMGLGDECGLQRAGFGPGHGHRHSVWTECHAGMRGGGVLDGHCALPERFVPAMPDVKLDQPSAIMLEFAYVFDQRGMLP